MGLVECTICGVLVSTALFNEFFEFHRNKAERLRPNGSLGMRDQQRFCRFHLRTNSAQDWRLRGYPEIDWTRLETARIPATVPSLLEILSRKRPSYYREKLENAARESRRQLQLYIRDESTTVIQYGYYGPRGNGMMTDYIIHELACMLVDAACVDRLVREVGVATYTTLVLVPEMRIMFVKEDYGIDNDDEARRLLSESTNLGWLVNGDEDS